MPATGLISLKHFGVDMMKRSFLLRLSDYISGFSSFLAMITMWLMMLLITADVIFNKVAGSPIPATVEVTAYYFMVFIIFLALPFIEKKQSHISADFIVLRFSEPVQAGFKLLGRLLTITFYSLLSYGAILQAIKSTQRLETAMSNFTFYIWPTRWAVVYGLLSAIIIIFLLILTGKRQGR